MASAEQLAAEMQSFYRQYIEVFNAEDLTVLAGLFSFPCALFGGRRGMNVMNDQEAFVRMMGKTKTTLKGQGWARTGIDMTHAWATAPDMGLLISDYTRYRDDGGVLLHGRACYTLRRDDAQWKIVSMMEIAQPFPGPGDVPRP